MMRVLNALFDDRYGGPQKRVIDVGRELLGRGVETLLLLPAGSGNAEEIAKNEGLKVARVAFNRIPKPKDVLKLLRWLCLLPKDIYLIAQLIRNNDIEVVHVNGAFFFAPALAAKVCRVPLVWHLNDTIAPSFLANILSKIVRVLADKIVVAADAVGRHYHLNTLNYTVIYAPVDTSLIQAKKSYQNDGNWRVGLVGNINPLKGIEVFVETASMIDECIRDHIEFVIAGSRLESHEDYAKKIDALISEKKLDDTVHCKGFVDDVPSFLRSLDVLILASRSEACPMAVLEAMAAGIPVVSTDVGGVRELLKPDTGVAAGFVVPVGDAGRMAEKIQWLLKDEAVRESMGINGRCYAEKLFSLNACVDAHEKTYVEFLGV